jgi:hypothetical protein
VTLRTPPAKAAYPTSVVDRLRDQLGDELIAVYPAVLDELIPSAWHHVEQYANNPRPITVDSNTGCDQCAGYEPIGQRK